MDENVPVVIKHMDRKLVAQAVFVLIALGSNISLAVQPESPPRIDGKSFGITLLLVPGISGIESELAKPTPKIRTVTQVSVGAPLSVVIIYWGGQPGADGNCMITFDLSIFDETGALVASREQRPLCVNHPPPPKSYISAGDEAVELYTSGKPARLTYIMTAVDRISGESLTASTSVELTK